MSLLFHFKRDNFNIKENFCSMRKLTLISICAISMLSLAGCSSTSSLSSKSDIEISTHSNN